MIIDNICPFCGKVAFNTNDYVITKGHRTRAGWSRVQFASKKQYFHRDCFEQNTIGAKKK